MFLLLPPADLLNSAPTLLVPRNIVEEQVRTILLHLTERFDRPSQTREPGEPGEPVAAIDGVGEIARGHTYSLEIHWLHVRVVHAKPSLIVGAAPHVCVVMSGMESRTLVYDDPAKLGIELRSI